ncbi:MAG: acetyl-CoA carboxylase biotin carboxyl carrier protein subunit [Bacteroidota bacterium]|nr:acetyl-CoA carboxylase biotin carboxyl carrier protein subunit [Bacteroidota bacterium]
MECDETKYSELYVNGSTYRTKLCKKYTNAKKWKKHDYTKITAFIPGTINEIFVKKGQTVKKGEEILILEAMKMKNRLKAPRAGVIKSILVSTNEIVVKNQLLVEFE